MTDKEKINSVFNKIMNNKYSTNEMLKELEKYLPELYQEYHRITGNRYIEDRLPEIKNNLEYISDRWTTKERLSFIITAVREQNDSK